MADGRPSAGPRARRIARGVLWLAVLSVPVRLAVGIFTDGLGANPIETLEHATGEHALRLLIASLAVTPLRRVTGWGWLAPQRRFLGLAAFWLALAHLLVYAGLDLVLDVGEIVEDVIDRPFITVGFAAFVMLLALAVTSPARMVRRLGGATWRRLHRLAYAAGILACVHFIWGVKQDVTEPVIYAVVLAAALAARLLPPRGAGERPGPGHVPAS